jgi:hypothetical protein
MLQLMASQSVCLGVEPTLEFMARYYFLPESCFISAGTLSDERSGLSFVGLSVQ